MKTSTFIILIMLAAVLLDLFYWAVIRKRWGQIRSEVQGFLEKTLHVKFSPPPPQKPRREWDRNRLLPAVEIVLILAFALWVGREYLNFDENAWPTGYEFGTSVRTHYNWIKFKECGLCFLWDGSINGGAPSFVDLHGSWLHPLVAVSTLAFGYVNGTKVVLLACLFLAGLAQWWLAKQLKVDTVPRLYTAFMAVAAGNLAATMELGNLGRLLSYVCACLALAGGFAFARNPTLKKAAGFGILVALLIISGQSYNQAGFLLALLPPIFLLVPTRIWKEKSTWKNILLAALLALLLAGFFLVPTLHFLPQITKWTARVEFETVQPLQYIPLNLLIDNYEFFASEALQKLPYVSFYALYIGWIPVLLALCAFSFLRKENARLFSFFWLSIALILLAGSGITFKFLALFTKMAYNFRFPSIISGFLVPMLLGLAALGLEGLLKMKTFSREVILPARLNSLKLHLNYAFLLLLLPLIFSIRSAYQFGHRWFTTVKINDNYEETYERLKLDHTEWVSISNGSHSSVYPMLVNDLKYADSFRPWWWKDRPDPLPYLKLYETSMLIVNQESKYASISKNEKRIPCTAHANAGIINVHCDSPSGGTLVVMENYWPGWKVWVDGQPAQLNANQQWLTLQAEPGSRDYLFRYLPLDVLIGAVLTLLGVGIAVFAFLKK